MAHPPPANSTGVLEAEESAARAEYKELCRALTEAKQKMASTFGSCDEVIAEHSKVLRELGLRKATIEQKQRQVMAYHAAVNKRVEVEFAKREAELVEREERLEAELETVRAQHQCKETVVEEREAARTALAAAERLQETEVADMEEAVKTDEFAWISRTVAGDMDTNARRELVATTTAKFTEMQREHGDLVAVLRSRGRRITELLRENKEQSQIRRAVFLDYSIFAEMNVVSHRKLAHLSALSTCLADGDETVVSALDTVVCTPKPPQRPRPMAGRGPATTTGRQIVETQQPDAHLELQRLVALLDARLRAHRDGARVLEAAQRRNADLATGLAFEDTAVV